MICPHFGGSRQMWHLDASHDELHREQHTNPISNSSRVRVAKLATTIGFDFTMVFSPISRVRAMLERTTSAGDLDHASRYSTDSARDVREVVSCESYPWFSSAMVRDIGNRALRSQTYDSLINHRSANSRGSS